MTLTKDPNSRLDYSFGWASWLEDRGDAIAEADVSRSSGKDDLTISDTAHDGKAVTFWLSGGSEGYYRITCRITTAAGRIDERSFWLKVEDR